MRLFGRYILFKCLCGLSMNLKKKDMYTCPNCGGIMLKEVQIKKLEHKLNKTEKEITAEEIEEVYRREPEIRDYMIKYPKLQKVADMVLALIKLLNVQQVSFRLKALSAFSLTYLISPIDVIPDFTPGIGLLDDIAVILMVVSAIGKIIHDLMPSKGILLLEPPLLYCFSNSTALSYEEGHYYRLWRLPIKDINRYRLEIYGGKLPQANVLYVSHPNFFKTLIPYENVDTYIFDSVLDEHISILAALGAKSIKYTISELKSDKLALSIELGNEIASKGVNVNKKVKSPVYRQCEARFDKKRDIPTKILEDVSWYFTEMGISGNIVKDRLLNNQTAISYTTEASSEIYLKLDSKKHIAELNFAVNSETTVSKFRKISFDVEFHTTEIKSSKKTYDKICNLLDIRKSELVDRYQSFNAKELQNPGRSNRLIGFFDRLRGTKSS